MNYLLIIAPILLLQGCVSEVVKGDKPTANDAGETARSAWEASVKPLTVVLEDVPLGVTSIGAVCAPKDASPEEREALANAVLERKGDVWTTDNPHAVLADSVPEVRIAWPKGLPQIENLSMPFPERLYGVKMTDTLIHAVRVPIFQLASPMAMLSVVTASDDRHDILDGLKVFGNNLPTSGTLKPYEGRWVAVGKGGYLDADTKGCLMASGRVHKIYLPPTDDANDVTLMAKVNGNNHTVKTTLPPMAAGSETRLIVRKEGSSLKITGSWVESNRAIDVAAIATVDTIKVGNYLRHDGLVVEKIDSACVAMVIDTDGKHGKAVALADCEGEFRFGSHIGVSYPTIDGKRVEGKVNPAQSDNVAADNRVVFTSELTWPEGCAFSQEDGATVTDAMAKGFIVPPSLGKTEPMLMSVQDQPSAYLPTLNELVSLYCLVNPLKGDNKWLQPLPLLAGQYLTCTQSTESSFYLFDFDSGVITQGSKSYSKAKVRLFYLF